jgi:hypothetical protein
MNTARWIWWGLLHTRQGFSWPSELHWISTLRLVCTVLIVLLCVHKTFIFKWIFVYWKKGCNTKTIQISSYGYVTFKYCCLKYNFHSDFLNIRHKTCDKLRKFWVIATKFGLAISQDGYKSGRKLANICSLCLISISMYVIKPKYLSERLLYCVVKC